MKQNILQTSLEAYQKIQPTLAYRRRQVYEILKKLGEATNTMIAQECRLPINCVVPRIFELRQFGYVCYSKEDFCPITTHKAIFWRCLRKKLK